MLQTTPTQPLSHTPSFPLLLFLSTKTMCGSCSTCDTWELSDVCTAYKYSYLIDNHATVAYAVFMCVWASLFLELWKRKQSRAAWQWGVNDYKVCRHTRTRSVCPACVLCVSCVLGVCVCRVCW